MLRYVEKSDLILHRILPSCKQRCLAEDQMTINFPPRLSDFVDQDDNYPIRIRGADNA